MLDTEESGSEEDNGSLIKRPRKVSPMADIPVTPAFGEVTGSEPQATEFKSSTYASFVVQGRQEDSGETAKPHPISKREPVISKSIPVGASLEDLDCLRSLFDVGGTTDNDVSSDVAPTATSMPPKSSDEGNFSTQASTSAKASEPIQESNTVGGVRSTGNAEPGVLEEPLKKKSPQFADLPEGEGLNKLWRFLASWREGYEILKKVRHRLRTCRTDPAPVVSAPNLETSPGTAVGISRTASATSRPESVNSPQDVPSAEATVAFSVVAMRLPETGKSHAASETASATSNQDQPMASPEQETSPMNPDTSTVSNQGQPTALLEQKTSPKNPDASATSNQDQPMASPEQETSPMNPDVTAVSNQGKPTASLEQKMSPKNPDASANSNQDQPMASPEQETSPMNPDASAVSNQGQPRASLEQKTSPKNPDASATSNQDHPMASPEQETSPMNPDASAVSNQGQRTASPEQKTSPKNPDASAASSEGQPTASLEQKTSRKNPDASAASNQGQPTASLEQNTSPKNPDVSVASNKGQLAASPEQETSLKPPDPACDDAVFKRPFPVSPVLSRTRGRTSSPSKSSAKRSTKKESMPTAKPCDATMTRLVSFSQLVHRAYPSLFPRPEAAITSILGVEFLIRNSKGGYLDSLCTHQAFADCWLLGFEDVLNEILLLHNLEIVQLPPRLYMLRHLGRVSAADAITSTPLDARREAIVMWLLRVHRCIRRLSLDLTAITKSPSTFCCAFSLHSNYRTIDIGVSGPRKPSCRDLVIFLHNVSGLVELSLFGLYVGDKGDGVRIRSLLISNPGILKLSIQRCQVSDRELAEIIKGAAWLPRLGDLALFFEKLKSCKDEQPGLKKLLNRSDLCEKQKLRLQIDTSYVAFLERLSHNQFVTELEITHKMVVASDLIPLLENTGLRNALKHLVLSLDMQSLLKVQPYEDVLQAFIGGVALDVLKLQNTVFTENGIRAIADGLKINGKPDAADDTTDPTGKDGKRSRKMPFLKELHLSGENLSCDELSVLADALLENENLQVLDIGLICATERTTHSALTNTILEAATGALFTMSNSLEKSPTAPFRVVKHHFPDEIEGLISAVRRDITFKKLSLVFSLICDEDRDTRVKEFGHLLAILPYYATLNTLQSVYIESNSCGLPDKGALGLAVLAFASTTLVEVNVSLGDCSSEFTSILLFEGLADSVSIRKLTMSGWCLNSPAELFFEHMCKKNKFLQRLYIHMSKAGDEGNATFLAHLPNAVKHCNSLVEFHLTYGTQREELFLHNVQSVLRQNQKLLLQAAKLVIDVARIAERREGFQENPDDTYLNPFRCRIFHRAEDMPELQEWLMVFMGWSIGKVQAQLQITKELIGDSFSGGETSVDEEAPNEFEDLRLGERSSAYDERYLQRLEEVNRAARDTYYEEHEQFAMRYKTEKYS